MVRPNMHTIYVTAADLPQVKATMIEAAARIRELEAALAAIDPEHPALPTACADSSLTAWGAHLIDPETPDDRR